MPLRAFYRSAPSQGRDGNLPMRWGRFLQLYMEATGLFEAIMMWWQDARQAGHIKLGSLVVNDSFNPCTSMKAWSKDLVGASTRRSSGERFSSRTIPLSDDRSVCYDVAWKKLTASSMLDSLSYTGAVDKVLSDEEGLSYFELLG